MDSILAVLLVLLVIAVIVGLYGVVIYNNLVSLKHGVSKAWSNIDVLLKQRYDELPKLVEVCRQHMRYEQETLERVMQARSRVANAQQSGDIKALGEAEGALRIGLGNLFAVAEAYPELTASDSFKHLQARISGLENAIADRREYYNESVNRNNVRIEQFPDVIVARFFHFKAFVLLEFSERERQDVNIKSLFS
ncbi:LemA family protein [Thiorhodospira sibirica]|uniref:LemA family protein n=1 Tax=Thiorhodospira sibirica TaxID=154347 RepID=UPI00022C0B7F|nr:LemA family protein [Thiorhodospira sibirica]